MSKSKSLIINRILNIVVVSLIGVSIIVFGVLYLETFDSGFFYEYKKILLISLVSLISVFTILTIIFYGLNKLLIFKLCLITIILLLLFVFLFYILKITGFLDRIDSVDDLRSYVSSFNNFAVLMFILLQFLQVVVLPIPSFITVAAGVLLFGPLKGGIYSCIGIITGSLVAYFIGRVFGIRVAKWLVGEDGLNKGLNLVKGKDKVVLTFMFLFPFFPDDVLCFVAGITTIGPIYFTIMIFITRLISVFTSCYSLNNSIIPYNTWWGILIWIFVFAVVVLLTIFICKYGDKIENFFKRKKSKKISK